MVKWMLIYALSVPSSDDLNAIQRGPFKKIQLEYFMSSKGKSLTKRESVYRQWRIYEEPVTYP